jgi:hypothetical protein
MTEERAWSWSEIADLTHVTQVENFGFCTCEEQEQFPYDDCPRMIECLHTYLEESAQGEAYSCFDCGLEVSND